MAKRDIEGQMDLFQMFDSEETEKEQEKEIQAEEELSDTQLYVEEEGELEHAVMQYTLENSVVAYMDYGRVYIKQDNGTAKIYRFKTTKDAVDFYVGQISRLAKEKA